MGYLGVSRADPPVVRPLSRGSEWLSLRESNKSKVYYFAKYGLL